MWTAPFSKNSKRDKFFGVMKFFRRVIMYHRFAFFCDSMKGGFCPVLATIQGSILWEGRRQCVKCLLKCADFIGKKNVVVVGMMVGQDESSIMCSRAEVIPDLMPYINEFPQRDCHWCPWLHTRHLGQFSARHRGLVLIKLRNRNEWSRRGNGIGQH